jgi:hypothetical protein
MKSKKYLDFFENLSINTPFEEYKKVFDLNGKFKDPFHEVIGLEKIYKIFQNMYVKLDNPKFKIIEVIEKDNIIYIKWNFEFRFKNQSKQESFEGISRVEFNNEGKAISHVDYWDCVENLYEKIPILSFFTKLIKNKLKS